MTYHNIPSTQGKFQTETVLDDFRYLPHAMNLCEKHVYFSTDHTSAILFYFVPLTRLKLSPFIFPTLLIKTSIYLI
jgi:hypothetical protein